MEAIDKYEDSNIFNDSGSSSSRDTVAHHRSEPVSVTPIPKKLADVMRRLRYIGGVPAGHKLNLTTMLYDDDSSWIDKSKRTLWYTSESKEGTVQMVEETTDEAISCVNEYRGSSYYDILINDIQTCSKGIKRLIDMYKDYPDTVNSLSLRLDDIAVALRQEGVSCSPPKGVGARDSSGNRESNGNRDNREVRGIRDSRDSVKVTVAGFNAGKSGDGSIVYHGN